MEEDLRKKYENYPDEKLIQVLVNADDYLPIAVQIAKEEAVKRNITVTGPDSINRQTLASTNPSKIGKNLDIWWNRIKGNPLNKLEKLYTEGDTTDRSITIISTVLCLMALSETWSGISYWTSMSFLETQEIIAGLIPSILMVVGLTISIVLLWKREGAGWYMSSIYCSLLLLLNGYSFMKSCVYYLQKDNTIEDNSLGDNSLIDLISLFEPEPALSYAPILIITMLLLYLLFRKETVAGFGFTSKDILMAGSAGLLLFGAFLLLIFYG